MAYLDDLHTGNSAIESTFGNELVPEEQTEAIKEQQQELQDLLPSVQHIVDAIDAEITTIADIRAYAKTLGENPKADTLIAEYRARELYIGFLTRLKESIADKIANAEAEATK